MNEFGYSRQGVHSESWNNRNNSSAMSKMEHTFWVTKQSVFRKLGKKEDECIVASDAELDAKLELFRSVQDTCSELQRILDKYQERLCNLAQEESAMGRFLKECSKRDQTNAGKAMVSVGRALTYSGQQRLALRVPLQRLYQEVETFRQRAIEDTLLNVSAMERQRTEYRAALSWMKNISQELDPDTQKQLEKFRKVQGQVRQSKENFDRLKLDCLQKVDLLAAARCNMFSHALTLYQQALIQHARRAQRAFASVAKDLKGYQHYEFSVVPELTEESSRLANQSKQEEAKDTEVKDFDKDEFFFLDTEYHDKTELAEGCEERHKSDSLQNLLNSTGDLDGPLLPFDSNNPVGISATDAPHVDLLASECLQDLNDVLGNPMTEGISSNASVTEDWESLLKTNMVHTSDAKMMQPSELCARSLAEKSSFDTTAPKGFLPSQLLESLALSLEPQSPLDSSSLEGVISPSSNTVNTSEAPEKSLPSSDFNFITNLMANLRPQSGVSKISPQSSSSSQPLQAPKNLASLATNNPNKKDMSAWFDLFADLDPLANPDAIESKIVEEERNC